MKIYIAGHRGMVGSAIKKELEKQGYSNFVERTSKELDLRNQQAVNDFFEAEKPDWVFLAAAKVGGIWANNTYRGEFIYDNLMMEANVIEAARKTNVKKLMFLGSSCIYPKLAPQPLKEEYLLTGLLEATNEPYAIAKIAGIKMCEAYRSQYDCNFISVMPTNLYGEGDNYDLMNSHVLPALIRKFHLGKCLEQNNWDGIRNNLRHFLVEGKDMSTLSETEILEVLNKYGIRKSKDEKNIEVEVWGTGSPKREFLHANDLAEACVYLMHNYNDSSLVNIGTGEDLSIKDLALLVKKTINFEGELVFDTSKPDGTPRKLMSVDKLTDLGWKYKTSLEEGINQVYKTVLADIIA
ncbi:nucleoside-diphosphate-sugar epimerase [Bernardetia litoralis DSM 6794]|uniref:GDP-L-fucose synthase n=1 Tax=Bernardetia litoralis (strain ATCC 23117 / DSM 6794 / NBRC 15988 / NCIMB 1366 / Fx l1 / Sio-4) TaxID=880071 RepID=I4APW6_BERLS|nr:nucleoside-diphosphate-sugar epimerase [Bernardetia litoralis DSM 6794]